jgi:hypothetical protein
VITKPTVFVLGAGSSQPYRFPSGSELVDRVWQRILHFGDDNRENPLDEQLKGLKHSHDKTVEFARELRFSRGYSIDRFLEMRPEFMEIGKAAIADVLLDAEKESVTELFPNEPILWTEEPEDRDWQRYLFDQLIRKAPSTLSASPVRREQHALERRRELHHPFRPPQLPRTDPR